MGDSRMSDIPIRLRSPGDLPFKSKSEDSIDGESVYSEFRSAMLFSFFPVSSVSHGDQLHFTLSPNCVHVQTLPIAQDTPVQTDSFSRLYDPYTHACKARPLSTDGWTSPSVIVIVIVSRIAHIR